MPVSVSSKFYFLSASCVFSEQEDQLKEWNGSMGGPICMLKKLNHFRITQEFFMLVHLAGWQFPTL